MSVTVKCNRRRFLAAAATAVAAPAVITRVAWAQGKPRPVGEEVIKRITDALPKQATVKPAKPRKVLVFYRTEGFYHDSIPVCNKALELMGQKTGAYEASVLSDDMAVFDPGKLDPFDGVIFNNTTRLTFDDPKHRQTLMAFVKGGKAVCGIHSATDNFYNWPEAAEMMGALFAQHPWGSGGTWAVKIDEPQHPLNKAFGGKGFLINDELYQMRDPYSREKLRVLVSLDMSKKRNSKGRPDDDNALAWIHRFGQGRVFYSAFGHNHPIFWNPAILRHYLDGIQYALGDLKVDDTPSAKLAKKPIPALCPEE
jgi:type 1 glutamine amidotransferase